MAEAPKIVHLRGEPTLRVRSLALVDLRLLRRTELNLELVAQCVQTPLRLRTTLASGFILMCVAPYILAHVMDVQQEPLEEEEVRQIWSRLH